MNSSIRIKDIAKAAQTSPATVSRVLNGVPTVNPEIAAKIRQVIEEFNYQPNEAGRNLRMRNDSQYGPDFNLRSRLNWDAKHKIAAHAAKLVSPSDVVLLDSGTTVAAMVPYLPEGLLVYTNSLAVLQPAAKRGLNVHVAPGLYVAEMAALFGEETETYFLKHRATKYFLSSSRVDVYTGLYNVNQLTSAVKKIGIGQADQVILLADHDKFCDAGLPAYTSLSDLDVIVADYVPNALLPALKASGVTVVETSAKTANA
ncbi:LacI family DNA-binding transcriptional regulator [Alicyclobacillus tolerans]|uniref:LacI family DNA-binding transcriptional regulator n=1 Tax=Alicyclobacillus tolerans TaxID=90970 RepID=UPI001EFFBE2C|nr:LacI family DNA-binding transcriptional regulator [Alicyclobacillus tolerans]MCF8568055.1 LacI family DNA-binding transcriptional regulator [Alicyclobacillus tolerans]